MDALFDISAEVPSQTINDFIRAFSRYKDEIGNSQAVAVRRGTIALVKSLRARTFKAKKMIPASDVVRADKPHYITPRGTKKPIKAWRITRRAGSPAERAYVHAADTKAEARKKYGKIGKWGLARQSWGWFMQTLFNRSAGSEGNPKAKVDGRMVNGYLREVITGPNPRVEVLIHDKLDYIASALPSGALNESMQAATRLINAQINKGLAKSRKELGL